MAQTNTTTNSFLLGDDVPLNLILLPNNQITSYADYNLLSISNEPRSDAFNLSIDYPIASLNDLHNEDYNQILNHLLNRLTSGYLTDCLTPAQYNNSDWFAGDLFKDHQQYEYLLIHQENANEPTNQTFGAIIPNKTFNLVFLATMNKYMQEHQQSIMFNVFKNSNEIYLSPAVLLHIINRDTQFTKNADLQPDFLNIYEPFTFKELMLWINAYETALKEALQERIKAKQTSTIMEFNSSSDDKSTGGTSFKPELKIKQPEKKNKMDQADKKDADLAMFKLNENDEFMQKSDEEDTLFALMKQTMNENKTRDAEIEKMMQEEEPNKKKNIL